MRVKLQKLLIHFLQGLNIVKVVEVLDIKLKIFKCFEQFVIHLLIYLYFKHLIINQFSMQPRDEITHKQDSSSGENKNQSTVRLKLPESLNSEEMKEKIQDSSPHLTDFYSAWKSESGFSLLLIQKLSVIVNNYFKMAPQLKRRNEEIEILITYNESLIQILNKFEDHERKVLTKLHTLQELNLNLMREVSIIKGLQFKVSHYKPIKSIFQNYSLNNLKFEKKAETQNEQVSEIYKDKLLQLFKAYLLEPADQYKPKIQEKIRELQQEKTKLIVKDHLKDLESLTSLVDFYNANLEGVSCNNMFELYEKKVQIKQEMKNLDISYDAKSTQNDLNQQAFVKDVLKIHANLQKMQENTLQKHLKQEKQIRRKLRKQRIREQEEYERHYEKIDTQNVELKTDITKLRDKLIILQEQLSKTKIELQIKSMKHNVSKVHGSMLNESQLSVFDGKQKRNKSKEVIRKLQGDLTEWKKKCEDLQLKLKRLIGNEGDDEKKKKFIINELKMYNIMIDQFAKTMEILEIVTQKYIALRKSTTEQKMEDSVLVSPPYEDRSNISFHQIDLKPIPEQHQTEELQLKLKELQNLYKELKQQNKRLKVQLDEKQAIIKKFQQKFTTLEKNQRQKVSKLNSLALEYENMKKQNEREKQKNRFLQEKIQLVQNLSKNLLQTVEHLTNIDIKVETFPTIADKMLKKLKSYIKKYSKDIDKANQLSAKLIIEENGKMRFADSDSFYADTSFSLVKNPSKLQDKSLSLKKKKEKPQFQTSKVQNESSIRQTNYEKQNPDKDQKMMKSSPPLRRQLSLKKKSSSKSQIKDEVQQNKMSEEEPQFQELKQQNNPRDNNSKQIRISDHSKKNEKSCLSQPPSYEPIDDSFIKGISQIQQKADSIKEKDYLLSFIEGSKKNDSVPAGKSLVRKDSEKQINSIKDSMKSENRSVSIPKINVIEVRSSKQNSSPSSISKQQSEKISQKNLPKVINSFDSHQISLNLSGQNHVQVKKSNNLNKKSKQNNFLALKEQEVHNIHNSGMSQRIDLDFVEKMYQKIERLKNNPDTVDFYELYQRYKQSLKCLEKQEKLNKMNQIRYQRFLEQLYEHREDGDFSDYSLEQQIYNLRIHVYELKSQLEEEQIQFESTVDNEVKQSRQTIKQHLKILNSTKLKDPDQMKRKIF